LTYFDTSEYTYVHRISVFARALTNIIDSYKSCLNNSQAIMLNTDLF